MTADLSLVPLERIMRAAFAARIVVPAYNIAHIEMLAPIMEALRRTRCFSLVEVLSTCPTNWGLSPLDAQRWLKDNMIPYYPLGVKKTPEDGPEAESCSRT